MLVTDRFTFAHIPKTGGEFLQRVIGRHFPVRQAFLGDHSHTAIDSVRPEWRDQPVFALVRNPWSWYVSWYTFCKALGDNSQFNRNFVPGAQSFKRTIAGLLRPNHGSPDIDTFMREHNIGLLEMHRFHVLCQGVDRYDATCGRMEHLATDLIRFLDARQIPYPSELPDDLAGEPTNTTRHEHYATYYDEELRDLVADKERRIITEFGYRFESASAR